MAVYELFPDYANATTFTDATGRTLGTEFDVASGVWATHIVFRRATATGHLPTHVSIWRVTGQVEIVPTVVAYSGNPAAGRVAVPLVNPVYLAPGDYVSAGRYAGSGTLGMPGWSAYWTTGPGASGHTAGPLTAPSSAASVGGQGRTIVGATRAYPSTGSGTGAQYGFSLIVTDDPPDGVNDSPSPCAASTTGWLAAGSSGATQGQITGLTGLERTTGYRVTNGAGAGNQLIYSPPAIKPADIGGLIPTTCMTVRSSSAATVVPYVVWTDAAGTQTTTSAGAGVTVAANVPTRIDPPRTAAPAGTRGYRLCAYIASAPASNQLVVTLVRLQLGAAAVTPFAYADGDMPGWVWDGAAGTSSSQRADDTIPVWRARLDASDTSNTTLATVGYRSTAQTQTSAGTFGTTSSVPVVSAPGGRPGKAMQVDVSASQRRVEMFPHDGITFAEGADYFFGFAFYLPAGFDTATGVDYQVIEQVRHGDAVTDGSPPVAFEVRLGKLTVGGGWGKPGASPATLYQWFTDLVTSIETQRWYHVVYRVKFSATAASTRLDVWVDGDQKITNFQIPGANIYAGAGNSYRKEGLYRDPSVGAETIYHAGSALGPSYVAVDPARIQTQQASAQLVAGTVLGGGSSLVGRAAAAITSGSRVEAAALLGATGSAVLVSGTAVGPQATRFTPGAGTLVCGVTVDAAPTQAVVATAAITVATTVAGDAVTGASAAVTTGGAVAAAAALDAGASATLTSGSTLGAGGVRASPASALLVSATVLAAGPWATSGAVVAAVSGTRVDPAELVETFAAAELASATRLLGDAISGATATLTSGTVVSGATVGDLGAVAVLVSATTLGSFAGFEQPAETAIVSGVTVEVSVFAEIDVRVDVVSATALTAGPLQRAQPVTAAIVSATVVDLDAWNESSVRVVITSGSRVEAAIGSYTPVFVAPPGPAREQTPLPVTRLLVADTVTGRLHFELPYTALSWSAPLNGIGAADATLPIEGVLEAAYAQGATDPRATLREVLLGPFRWSLVVAHGDVALFGGPYIPSEDSAGGTIKVGAAGMERMLERRVLVNTDPRLTSSLSAPDRDLVFPQTTPGGAIWRIVSAAMDTYGGREPARGLPITCRQAPVLLGDETFTYLAYDVVAAWKAVSDITGRDDGPDARLEPYLVDGPDGTYCMWDLQIGDPFLPASGNHGPSGPMPWTFDDTTCVITRSVDAASMATAWWSTGDGQDREKRIVRSATDTLTARGFPTLEHVDTGSSSQTELYKLEAGNRAALAAHQAPADTWKLSAPVDGDPPLGAVRRGELARLDVTRQVLIEPGYYPRRITEVSGDASAARFTMACDEMEQSLVETDPIPPSTGRPEPYVPPSQAPAPAVKVRDLTGPGQTDVYSVGGTDLGIPVASPDGTRLVVIFGDTFEQAGVGGPGWRSPVALFAAPPGSSTPAAPAWKAATDTAVVGASLSALGYRSTAQTQGTDNVYGTTSAISAVTAPGGRGGVALPISVTSAQKRVESFPHSSTTFLGGSGPWFFSFAFYLPVGFPMGTADFQVIEQLKQASTQGSPPIAIEALGGQLLLTGGYGIDAANVNRLKYSRVLAASLQTERWYSLVYRVSAFSTAEASTVVDVWLDGEPVLEGFTVPPPTVITDPTGANGSATYRKQGLYHDAAKLGAASIYFADAALGTSFAAVDPAPTAPAAGTVSALTWTGAAGPGDYAAQIAAYTHNATLRGETVSTVLPTDLITIGSTMYLHVMACNGLGNVRFTELLRSTDQGETWTWTGVTWPGTAYGGLFQLPTFCDGGDGYIYALATGFQRDKGLALFRVPAGSFSDPAAWRAWNGAAWATSGPVVVLPGSFGEMCLRRLDGKWVLTGFNAGTYSIDAWTFDSITGDLTEVPRKVLLTGTSWDREDHARGQVAQLYGGYIVPGSSFENLHLVVSQWNTSSNWPYRAMQFRSSISDLRAQLA